MTDAEQRIIDAAAGLFGKHGYHGASMRAIAEVAGVSIGAIYHHYPSKQDVFIAIFRREFERRRGVIEALRTRDLCPETLVREIARVHFAMLEDHRDSVGLLVQALPASMAGLRSRLLALEREFAGYLAELLEEGIRAGDVRPCHTWTAAYAILGMTKVVTARALGEDAVAKELRAHGPDELAEFAWRALCAEKEEGT